VDDPERLDELLTVLSRLGCDIPVVFPVHPRTRQRISPARLSALPKPLRILDPLDYISFLTLMKSATLVITDSGGVQEETTFLDVPCLTIRPNTERPVTVELGTNRLVPSTANLLSETARIIAGDRARGTVPELWDGQTAGRIVRVLAEIEGIQLAARAGASITHIVRSAGEAHLSV
jgi:UDP-N-acetylglucosamine 2-epimerase (non-hydrolysing)